MVPAGVPRSQSSRFQWLELRRKIGSACAKRSTPATNLVFWNWPGLGRNSVRRTVISRIRWKTFGPRMARQMAPSNSNQAPWSQQYANLPL